MSRVGIHETIVSLAQSQGFYGRLLHNENYEQILDILEEQDLNDPVDLVLFLET